VGIQNIDEEQNCIFMNLSIRLSIPGLGGMGGIAR
jgi:hypothetical protein